MIKIIYFDIDGTLRSEVNKVSPKTKYAIEQCNKNGIACVICTGRNPSSIQEDVKQLPMSGVISGGGCFVQYKNKTIAEQHFQCDVLEEIINACLHDQIAISLESKNSVYMNKEAAQFYQHDFAKKINRYDSKQQEEIYQDHKIVFEENIGEFQKDKPHIHKICVIGPYSFINSLSSKMKDEICVIQKREWENDWFLEVLPKGCNKGLAIRELNRQLNIERRETMCFGDSENDIDMMKEAGISVAMDNDILKNVASSVCEPVEDDGVYKELVRRKLILPERQ